MKTKILGISLFVLTLVNAVLYFGATQHSLWVYASVSLVVSLSIILFVGVGLIYVRNLTKNTNAIVTGKSNSVQLSFDNINQVEQNHSIIKKKLELSASYIASLGQLDKTTAMDPLLANDSIGNALLKIEEEMRIIKEREDKHNWVTQGLAKFGEILRNKKELKEYASQIISNLVKYVGANQGALFIEFENEQDGRYLELAACYAYDRKQFQEKRIMEGEGLLGQCMLEKDIIFLTEIPKEYVKITSGLGYAVPRNIVVVPLLVNDQFYGAIELALFEVLQPHQIKFLKEVAESIASEISSIKSFEKTQRLLQESNVLANELQTREEEMRQNLEELAATQEEMARKQLELTGVFSAIDTTLGTAEFDAQGKLIRHNAITQSIFGYSSEQMTGMTYRFLLEENPKVKWSAIIGGVTRSADLKAKSKRGEEVWLSVTFTPVHDSNHNVVKVLCMIQDITEKKVKEQEFQRLSLVANNTDNSVIITDRNGLTEYVNSGFTKMTGFTPDEIIGKKPGELLQGPLTDKETIKKLSDAILGERPVYEEILNYNKRGETYWVSVGINPVKNEVGEVVNFIAIQADITQTKIRALDFTQKMEALSRANAIIEIDSDGNILDINKNYLDILGYDKEELVGKPYNLITRHNTVYAKIVTNIQERGIQSGVYSRYDKAGNRHCFKLTDYPVYDINGNIKKIIEFGMDVTNEKRLEIEAEKKRAELNSYLSAINNTIASAEFDLNGNFVSGNDIFLKITGFTSTDAGKHITKSDATTLLMWDNLKEGKFFSGEFTILDKEGKELWLTGTFNPISSSAGEQPDKIMMLAQFTTQEKEKLNDLNTMVNALKSTLPVVELNDSFSCKTANEKFLKMFGITRLDIRNKTLFDLVDPSYHQFISNVKDELLARDFSSLKVPVIKDNETLVFEASLSVSRRLDGSISKLILILIKESEEQVNVRVAV